MGRDHFLLEADLLPQSRRRRFRIGDLMVAVAMTAIGLAVIGLPRLKDGERRFLAVVTLAFLALQWTQWGLASIPAGESLKVRRALLGIVSSFLAMAMFVLLFILGLVFPQGAALLSVMMLIQVVYLTTWD